MRGKGLQEILEGGRGVDRVGFDGLRQADDGKVEGRGEQSALYSHSLNPLWNRSMKCLSPAQKRKVRKER